MLEHLSAAERIGFGAIGLDGLHRAWLPPPGVVDEQFGIHTEELIEQFVIPYRLPGHIAHGAHAVHLQSAGYTSAHAPEIRDGRMAP